MLRRPRSPVAPTGLSDNEHVHQRRVTVFRVIHVNDEIRIREDELDERFVRASGPGGQHVNKVATAVQLRFNVAASSLPARVKQRLRTLAGARMTADGVLLIDCREHRTQGQNREEARQRLSTLLQEAAKRPTPRRPSRPTAGSRERRLQAKTRRSRLKDARRRQDE